MNERLEIEGAPVAVRGTEIAAVGPASAVFLKSGKLNHVVAIDDRNRFRRALGLPLGVGTGDIRALACDRNVVSILTKDAHLHVYSINHAVWVASAALVDG